MSLCASPSTQFHLAQFVSIVQSQNRTICIIQLILLASSPLAVLPHRLNFIALRNKSSIKVKLHTQFRTNFNGIKNLPSESSSPSMSTLRDPNRDRKFPGANGANNESSRERHTIITFNFHSVSWATQFLRCSARPGWAGNICSTSSVSGNLSRKIAAERRGQSRLGRAEPDAMAKIGERGALFILSMNKL